MSAGGEELSHEHPACLQGARASAAGQVLLLLMMMMMMMMIYWAGHSSPRLTHPPQSAECTPCRGPLLPPPDPHPRDRSLLQYLSCHAIRLRWPRCWQLAGKAGIDATCMYHVQVPYPSMPREDTTFFYMSHARGRRCIVVLHRIHAPCPRAWLTRHVPRHVHAHCPNATSTRMVQMRIRLLFRCTSS